LKLLFIGKLIWKEHINNTDRKTLARISDVYILRGNHSNLSHVITLQLHMTRIRPVICCGCKPWTYAHKSKDPETADDTNQMLKDDPKISQNKR
jgi:hypothetical protein